MKTFKKLTSIICSITLVVLALVLTISFLLKYNLREEEISTYIKDNDLTFVLKNIDGTENDIISDTKIMLDLLGIPEDTIDSVLNSDATKEFIGKYLTDILEYLIYGTEKTVITSQDLTNLVEENFEIIENTLNAQGLSFTDEQKNHIYELIEEYADEVMDFFPTANVLLNKLEQKDIVIYNDITLETVTDTVEYLTSREWIIINICLIILSAIIIIICNLKSRETFKYFKVSTLSYSFILIIIEVLLGTIIKTELMDKIVSAQEFINYMINALSKNLWVFIIVSLFLTIIFQKLQKGRKNNAPILDQLYKTDGKEKESNKK